MLVVAIGYRKVYDAIASDKKNKLRAFEMGEEEWEIATQLRNVLKVSGV